MKSPRILGILSALVMLYGVWIVAPRWLEGVLGLLILYAVVTNADRAIALINQADGGLAGLIKPRTSPAGRDLR